MKEYWSRRIRDAVPYVPGEQPRGRTFIKLNTNENPYPPSPKVVEAVKSAAGEGLRFYPDPECAGLRAAAAKLHGVTPEQVFPGNGSDEVLAFCFQAFFDPERPILFADITYTFYAVYTDYFGLKAWQIPLDEDFSLPVERFCKAENCGGVVIANPNAPTGRSVDLEAYVDFGGVSADTLLKEYDNLVVVRTLSKSRALAGLRVGYALGSPNLIAGLCCVRDSINSYTVDRLAQAGAVAALEDGPYFEEMRERVIRTRERTEERLRAMGFAVLESKANFLFVSHPKRTGKALLDGLREQGILVRWFDRPRIGNYLRISVGTDDEMDALCAALKALTEG